MVRWWVGVFLAGRVSVCLGLLLGWGWGLHRRASLGPPVGCFAGRSWLMLLCGSFVFSSFLCLLCLCVRLFVCALWSPAGKGLTSWLSFVVYNCVFVTFPLVSWVRCGAWLYRFLIFPFLLTFARKSGWVSLNIMFCCYATINLFFHQIFGYVVACSTNYATLWLHLWRLNDTKSYIIRKISLFIGWPLYIYF